MSHPCQQQRLEAIRSKFLALILQKIPPNPENKDAMIKFYITSDERNQAQKRAEALDVGHSDPPGQHPFVWDNGLGYVNRWYNYASAEVKIGTISLKPIFEKAGLVSQMVECTTEITRLPLVSERKARRVIITNPDEHKELVDCFFRELLDGAPKGQEGTFLEDIMVLRRRIEELEALNQVATILNSAHDLKTVLELAIERIGAALHAKAGSLLLRDETTGELVFAVALGRVAEQLRGRRLAAGQGIAGWVVQNGEGVLVSDTSTDHRFSAEMDQESGFVTRSILSAPLKTSQGIIGVVELLNHTDGRPFAEADLRLLEAIAMHAAVVIEKARLLERGGELTAPLNLTENFGGPL